MTKESDRIIKDINKELKKLTDVCVDEVSNREFSKKSKLPYKLASFIYSMSWRMKECGEAALMLIDCDMVHPSLTLIRCSLENAGIMYSASKIVEEAVGLEELPEDTDAKLMRLLFANKYWKEEQSEHDLEYRAERVATYIDAMDMDYPGVKKYYHYLCEFVHTNSDGVGQSYSYLDEINDKTYYGPQLNENHSLFPAFVITLQLALTIYNNQVQFVNDNFEQFVILCDKSIDKQ
ncbi:MAG: hypothetical protein MJY76_06960 [Bacteroidales bacterium]|nr:hypothetical protein [Bacteroidales bacterium]